MARSRGGAVFRTVIAASAIAVAAGCGSVNSSVKDAAPDVPGVAIDAAIDAPVDAPARHKYDIGYVNEFTLAPNNRVVVGFVVVVNMDTVPLKATAESDLVVVSFSDNSPLVEWQFLIDQRAAMAIAPGHAAGLLSPLATEKIVTSGIVTEPNDDTFLDFAMSFVVPPPAGITFNAQAVVRIDGEDITLPFTIHTLDTNMVTFHSAKRVSSSP